MSTACIVLAAAGAIVAKGVDSGPMHYVGAALIGFGCAGFLAFTAGYWLVELFTDEPDADR